MSIGPLYVIVIYYRNHLYVGNLKISRMCQKVTSSSKLKTNLQTDVPVVNSS